MDMRLISRYGRISAQTRVYKLRLTPTLAAMFEDAAAHRQIPADALLHRLMVILLRDNLLGAVLDDDDQRTPPRDSVSPS